jgi:hypothetical protein
MEWNWLDILIVVLGALQIVALVTLVVVLLKLRRGVETLVRRLAALKDPTVVLASTGQERALRLWEQMASIGADATGLYRALRPEPVPGMPITYSSILRGFRDGMGTLATLKAVQGRVFRKKQVQPPPGPPGLTGPPRKPSLKRRLRDSLVPPVLLPVLNNLPNIAFAVGILRTVLDTVRKQQQQEAAGAE